MEETPEPPHEQGKLIRLPSRWVPPDGVQPLNGPGEEEREPSSGERGLPVFEAGDFWESGDTQQFVGVATGPPGPPPATASDDADPLASKAPAKESSSGNNRRDRIHARPKVAAIASIAACLLVGGGIALATAGHPGQHSERHASLAANRPRTSAESAAGSIALEKFHADLTANAARHTSRRVQRSARRHNTTRSHPVSGVAVPVHYVTPLSTPATTSPRAGQSPNSQAPSQPVESSPPGATAASQPAATSLPAGPSGPGYVIGSNCDPKEPSINCLMD